jgi:hypothetical protein
MWARTNARKQDEAARTGSGRVAGNLGDDFHSAIGNGCGSVRAVQVASMEELSRGIDQCGQRAVSVGGQKASEGHGRTRLLRKAQ